ncbi:hypothetical protein [Ectobacillus ponti]|uniref:Uncharacterized protein n=1 Tax=Ectobacillus ponti TaxID=2961894 RepID=A0AA41X6E5_9BACI|nr:hypothetical protein [Ectobacillus ponti]MCP8969647.1 hypothetical protein [Ectobacillus ponti]
MIRRRRRAGGPTIAPGMDRYKDLNRSATEEEVARGEYTKVIRMSWDEVDPSGKD